MGRPAGWMKALTGRSPMKSPGAPSHRREVERLFWDGIARGLSSEDAAAAVGVSSAAGTRWFRQRGGMSPFGPALTGRYLSFADLACESWFLAPIRQSPTADLKDAVSTCTQLGIAAFGAILGLIGGNLS